MLTIREQLESIVKMEINELEEAHKGDGEYHGYGMSKYIEDKCLDIHITIQKNGKYFGCRLITSFGGPSVYIDTIREEICAHWGNEKYIYPILNKDIIKDINDYVSEYYNSCIRNKECKSNIEEL